jgi:hypothetical protein
MMRRRRHLKVHLDDERFYNIRNGKVRWAEFRAVTEANSDIFTFTM